MSTKVIAQVLAESIKLHQTFNQLALEKMRVLQERDMPALDKLMKAEAVHLRQLRTLEGERIFAVGEYVRKKGWGTESVTLGTLIELLPEQERLLLKKLQAALVTEINKLKNQNELNQQLIEDSLRFVNLSLDLIQPEPEEVAYKRPSKRDREPGPGYSMFDSKA